MLIYKDIISGDELCSDSYPCKVVDDIVYEFDGKNIVVDNNISEAAIGGNASAEGGSEELCDQAETVINIVYSHKLFEMFFTKKTYTAYIKSYMKAILEKLTQSRPDRVDVFKSKAQKYVMSVIKNFDEYRFFTGETMNPEGMVILCNYREDQITPYFILFKDGLEEEKF